MCWNFDCGSFGYEQRFRNRTSIGSVGIKGNDTKVQRPPESCKGKVFSGSFVNGNVFVRFFILWSRPTQELIANLLRIVQFEGFGLNRIFPWIGDSFRICATTKIVQYLILNQRPLGIKRHIAFRNHFIIFPIPRTSPIRFSIPTCEFISFFGQRAVRNKNDISLLYSLRLRNGTLPSIGIVCHVVCLSSV